MSERRWTIDLAVLIGIGLLMGLLGPFGTARLPDFHRHLYWMSCMVGGGMIGVGLDLLLARALPPPLASPWRRAVLVALLMTPLVAVWVQASAVVTLGDGFGWRKIVRLFGQVLPLALTVMLVRALVWRTGPTRIETRTIVAPPSPEAEAAFRQRLSARRRTARLIAVEAHDHYLKIHTDAGEELITLRFADALAELDKVHGWRVHRSWWVAADAIQEVRWRRGAGEARLAGGLSAPVSRTYAPTLKDAGWRP